MISDLIAVFMEFWLKANDWDVLFKMFLIGEMLFHVYSVHMYHSLYKYPVPLRNGVNAQWLPKRPDSQMTWRLTGLRGGTELFLTEALKGHRRAHGASRGG